MSEPTSWQEIKTFDALERFQIEFRAMTQAEREVIIVEMLAVIEVYRMNIEVIEPREPRQVEKNSLLVCKRRGRGRTRKTRLRDTGRPYPVDQVLHD